MIPLFKVRMTDSARNNVAGVLRSGYIAQGKGVDLFEKNLQDLWETTNVATTNSCTSAIHLAFHLIKQAANVPKRLGSRLGSKVIASPLTCSAGIFPIIANGFDIVWADVDHTLNIDLNDLWRKLDSDTQIVSFVHWGGAPIDFYRLQQIKLDYERKYRKPLYIVEDCAHALDSRWGGKKISTIMPENFKCYSFQAIKHLTTGDGGALICPDWAYASARKARWFGLDRDNDQDFRAGQDIPEWGFKFHMNDIAAAIGCGNFRAAKDDVIDSISNSQYYDLSFRDCPQIIIPKRNPNALSSCWLYTILVPDRDAFIDRFKDSFGCNPVHRRNDTLSCMKSCQVNGYINYVDNHMVSIPVGWWVTRSQQRTIVEDIKEFYK